MFFVRNRGSYVNHGQKNKHESLDNADQEPEKHERYGIDQGHGDQGQEHGHHGMVSEHVPHETKRQGHGTRRVADALHHEHEDVEKQHEG